MPITFTCPNCGKQMNVADEYAGQTGPCASCGKPITIPAGGSGYTGISGSNAVAATGAGISLGLVIAIVLVVMLLCAGVLVALLLPAVQAAREAARRTQSMNNVKQLALAMHNYHDTYGSLPPAVIKDENGTPLYSGRVLLLPYLEQAAIYNAFDKTKAWNAPENAALSSTRIPLFNDPSSPIQGAGTNYLFLTGPGSIFDESKPLKFSSVTDGLSTTAWIVETKNANNSWAEPSELDISQLGGPPPGNHPGIVLIGMGDGSVKAVSNNVDPAVWRALLTRDGGEPAMLP